ncbi:hypothetical protein FBY26_2929 [Phycicoccus sp. SLBN-51]|nr:hypothetical protein FBY26_2929 [Phycicoccus sp. SLBN-51]
MTMWLLVLLVIVVMGALMWRSERRRRTSHPGSGLGDGTAGRESGRGQFYTGGGTGGGAAD